MTSMRDNQSGSNKGPTLANGDQLNSGDYLLSPSGDTQLTLYEWSAYPQEGVYAELNLSNSRTGQWTNAIGPLGRPSLQIGAKMNNDNNFVIMDTSFVGEGTPPIWQSNTSNKGKPGSGILQVDDIIGLQLFVIIDGEYKAVWTYSLSPSRSDIINAIEDLKVLQSNLSLNPPTADGKENFSGSSARSSWITTCSALSGTMQLSAGEGVTVQNLWEDIITGAATPTGPEGQEIKGFITSFINSLTLLYITPYPQA